MNRSTSQTSSPTICQLSVWMHVRWQLGGIPKLGRDCAFRFSRASPFCYFILLDSMIDISPRIFSSPFDYMYLAIIFGYVTTAGAPNVSIPSPNSGCSTRSRSVFPIHHAFGPFPMVPIDPERYHTLACRIQTNRTRSNLSVCSLPSPLNSN